MKATAFVMAFLLPAAAWATPLNPEEKGDTTVVYNKRQIVISDSADYMKVRVYDKRGEEYKPYYEGRFNDMTEEETFFITSPFYPKSYLRSIGRYESLVPAFFFGVGTISGSALGFGNNGVLHLQGLQGNFEAGMSLLSLEYSEGRRGFGLSYTLQAFVGESTFKKGYVLGNDVQRGTAVLKSDDPEQRGHMAYLGARMRLMPHYLLPLGRDRIGFGLGCSFELREGEHTFWKKKDKDYRDAESAYLNMHRFGFGLDAQISWNGWFLFAHKSLTPMFDTEVSPKAYPFTIGFGFAF